MEHDTTKEIFHDQQILNDSSAKRNKHRKNSKYCDYTLKTEDGGSFSTHINILASVSPFFEKMFNFESDDKEKDSVTLKRCSSVVLEKIIEFMYTGKVVITSDDARAILDTALFLRLNTLVDTCTRVLIRTANCDNCFELLACSETYFSGEALATRCIEIICKNIETFKDSSGFRGMSLDSMRMLCSCDRSLCNDEQLYSAIVQWVKSDMENRERHISVLLDQIIFQEISLRFAIENFFKENSLWKSQDYFSKIMGIMSKNLRQQLNRNGNDQKIIYRFEPNNLYAVVGDKMLLYDSGTKSFSRIITQSSNYRWGMGCSTFGGKNVFVCGGEIDGKKSNDCTYFSLRENCWKSLPSMEIPRFHNRAITLNEKIYVCGGWEEKTVEIFDINESKWSRGPSFDRDMPHIGLCLYNENIYGVQGTSLQFLDPRTHKWMALPLVSQSTEGLYSAINYKDYIYGFGFKQVFTFDIRANKWLENVIISEHKFSNNFPRSCMIEDEIYVFAKTNVDGEFVLNSYQASNLSDNICRSIKLEWENAYCQALFSF